MSKGLYELYRINTIKYKYEMTSLFLDLNNFDLISVYVCDVIFKEK